MESLLGRVVIIASVNENIILATVPMQVTVEQNLSLLSQLFDHFTRVPHRRKRLFEHCLVITVQVATGERASVVADHHSVRVQHRHYLENERVTQKLRVRRVSQQIVQKAFHHP